MVPFISICQYFQLEAPISSAIELAQTSNHRLWLISTKSGRYIIKQIAKLPQTYETLISTQYIAWFFKNKNLRVLPALIVKENCLLEWENYFYLVFPYLEGQVLTRDKVNLNHINDIAKTLGAIHADSPVLSAPEIENYEHSSKDWQPYCSEKWLNMLHKKCYEACTLPPSDCVISHRDLNLNNIIWQQNTGWLIDWDWAGKISRTQDVIATGLNMSLTLSATINLDLLTSFIHLYPLRLKESEIIPGLYRVLANWLNWCHINLAQNKHQNEVAYSMQASHHVSDNLSELAELILDAAAIKLKPSIL